MANVNKLLKYAMSKNIADMLSADKLTEIYQRVYTKYMDDCSTRTEWERVAKQATKYAKMGEITSKDTPWEGASNMQHPIIARAVIQFNATAMPEVIRQGKIAQSLIIGRDVDEKKYRQAKRVEDYLNYKLINENDRWTKSLDKGLSVLATVGTVFKKVYYDPTLEDNVSELCLYNEVYIDNNTSCLEDARRITHRHHTHRNTIIEWMNCGYYSKLTQDELKRESNESTSDEGLHVLLEQHCYLDLDGDGYEEPYIVIIDETIEKVLNISARFDIKGIRFKQDSDKVKAIRPINYFVDYHFIPSFDGSFYSLGFGQLLLSMAHAMNTGYNELLDAGRLANTQMGFIEGSLTFKSGDLKVKPGSFMKIPTLDGDVRKSITQFKFPEPSTVLFQLLGIIDQTAKELTSTTDIMMGNQLAQNAPVGTTNALLSQGMKIYNAIQKRIFSSLTKELKIFMQLNSKYLDEVEYKLVLDDPEASMMDFMDDTIDIMPVADPEIASDTQRLVQSQQLLQLYPYPEVSKEEVLRRHLQSIGIADPENVINLDQRQPTADEIAAQQQQQEAQAKYQLDMMTQQLKHQQHALKMEQQRFREQLEVAKITLEQKEQQLKELELKLSVGVDHRKQDMDFLMNERKLQTETEVHNAGNRESGR